MNIRIFLLAMISASTAFSQERVPVADGTLEGVYNPATEVRSFKGIPFAAPPVGNLRWQPPQPAQPWEGVRRADKFGPRAMQRALYGDMIFRSDGMSEDCLYLNVWTPGQTNARGLPVLVYFYGGGLQTGDGSEARYDGEHMAREGMVAVTVNYRLNVFGFLAHPGLTAESPHHASGNYGFLDQRAALEWVQRNVGAFGGDPRRVTIGGESAGSFSVSAQMASPLSKGLMAQALGESGALIGGEYGPVPLETGEATGTKFAASLGIGDAPTLAALRELPAEKLLAATALPGFSRFLPTVDGYFLPKMPVEIYRAGEQAHLPLLAGVNTEEAGYAKVLDKAPPTLADYREALQRLYPKDADEVFRLYPASDETGVMDAAQALASDRVIRYGTWRWTDLATATGGGQPTFFYVYAHPRPPAGGAAAGGNSSEPRGAVHAAEIEYALGNLDGNKAHAWTPEDREVSRMMQAYFVNFIKTGQPNGDGLPEWPKFAAGQHLVIDLKPHPESNEPWRARYEFFDRSAAEKAKK